MISVPFIIFIFISNIYFATRISIFFDNYYFSTVADKNISHSRT